jgi:hypothetical protein
MLFSSMPAELPPSVLDYLRGLHARVANADVGFRRQNMPALLLRFFLDMAAVLANCRRALRSGGEAMIVVGDNRTQVDGEFERIPTTDFLADIAGSLGLLPAEHIDISVTTENLVHIKNAITKNVVLRFRKP